MSEINRVDRYWWYKVIEFNSNVGNLVYSFSEECWHDLTPEQEASRKAYEEKAKEIATILYDLEGTIPTDWANP